MSRRGHPRFFWIPPGGLDLTANGIAEKVSVATNKELLKDLSVSDGVAYRPEDTHH